MNIEEEINEKLLTYISNAFGEVKAAETQTKRADGMFEESILAAKNHGVPPEIILERLEQDFPDEELYPTSVTISRLLKKRR
jgi:hypothetical protein